MKTNLILWVLLAATAGAAERPYVVVGTGQTKCYDNRNESAPPKPGQPFYGQDAQYRHTAASYTKSADGLTVLDNNTRLTWQSSPETDGDGTVTSKDKVTLTQALALPAKLNAAKFGGFSDWRLPTIKELYSLIQFSGVDVRLNDTDMSRLTPFIDTKFFKFAYGEASAGERIIDSQWATCTTYVANPNQMFGVNFADGRIKGYGTSMRGRGEKTFYVLCVRGNPAYGKNDFHDNGNGTITDRATGLMWPKADSGKGMNWEAALAWVQQRNAEKYLGHSDWRLPNAKELQSLVDYTRSPMTSHSAAIDPLFQTTTLSDGEFPFFWSSTTHQGGQPGHEGGAAAYVAFGRATGWMQLFGNRPGAAGQGGGPSGGGPGGGGPRFGGPGQGEPPGFGPPPSGGSGNYQLMDVHGAGAQRSDPKTGDPAAFPHGRGPQGDVIRILNFVRCVRDAARP